MLLSARDVIHQPVDSLPDSKLLAAKLKGIAGRRLTIVQYTKSGSSSAGRVAPLSAPAGLLRRIWGNRDTIR